MGTGRASPEDRGKAVGEEEAGVENAAAGVDVREMVLHPEINVDNNRIMKNSQVEGA